MKGNRPVLTLSMDDKIYLAVAKKDLDKLSFVYTMFIAVDKYNQIRPTETKREIHTFTNKDSAQIYHATISQIVDANINDKTKESFFKMHDDAIMNFDEYTR